MPRAPATELVFWHRVSDCAPKGCGLLFLKPTLLSLLFSVSISLFFLHLLVALRLRSLRFHSPRLCRVAVFLIQTNVSLTLHHPRSPGTAIMLSANVSLCLIWAQRRQAITQRCTSGIPTTPSGEGRRGEPLAALAIELVSESQRLHVVGHVSPFGMEPEVRSRCSFRVCVQFAVLPAHAPPSFAPSLLSLSHSRALVRALALSETEPHIDRLNRTERDRGARTHARTRARAHTHTHAHTQSHTITHNHTHTHSTASRLASAASLH